GHVAVDEAQPVPAGDRDRAVREPRAMQRGEEEVARAVAGEDAARAVAAVRGRSEAHDQQAGLRVAPARDRPAPVLLVPEATDLDARHGAAPGPQAAAALAGDDVGGHGAQRVADAARHRARAAHSSFKWSGGM